MQMLFAKIVIYTVYTALENRKIALNRVCADKNITFPETNAHTCFSTCLISIW